MKNNLSESLDALLESQYSADAPGAAVLVAAQGEILYERGIGMADLSTGEPIMPHTNFRMASVSKQFTAYCVQLLVQRGLVSYDAAIHNIFSGFKPAAGQITLRHLLTHSSGLLDYEEFVEESRETQVTDEEVLAITASQSNTYFRPGTQYRYSNTGYVLLALVVERVTGQLYDDFLKENVFEPLGMQSSTLYTSGGPIAHRAMGYARDGQGGFMYSDQGTCTATRGDGCIYTSLQDYQKWHKALTQMQGITTALEQVAYPLQGYANGYYGMGWFCSERTSGGLELYHTGNTSGFSHLVIGIPEQEVLIAYFSNIADNPHLLTGFLDGLKRYPALCPESWLVRDLLHLTR
ncbi:serine hydrolase domain-containing protein [Pontibacter roseus]|uniref:serine hydrolase domain-containing protein n=1 Tax=Pontibacter roseus TaxID=336989 RepID=UPI0012F77E29|nr:serine hydrolase domain-containing protein [Pontibacter roseus]